VVPEDQSPNIAMALANLANANGSDRATVVALTKILAELTAFTQNQAAELHHLSGISTLVDIAPRTKVLPGSATVVRGTGHTHTFERQQYKTKNRNSCWSHGYQIGGYHTSFTCTKRNEVHNLAATNDTRY
jgi:hypothetical protein